MRVAAQAARAWRSIPFDLGHVRSPRGTGSLPRWSTPRSPLVWPYAPATKVLVVVGRPWPIPQLRSGSTPSDTEQADLCFRPLSGSTTRRFGRDLRGLSHWAHILFVTVCHSRHGTGSIRTDARPVGSRGSSSPGPGQPAGPEAGAGEMADRACCEQHESSTGPGVGEDQHAGNTAKTVFPGARRRDCQSL